MSNSRPWIAGAAGASVVLVLAGWFLAISPQRSKAADLHSQTTAQVQANQRLQLDIAQLKAQFKTLPAKQAELAVIQRQMPSTPGLPTLIRNLSSLAKASGVTLSTVAPGAPVNFVGGSHQTAAGTTGTAASTPATGATTAAAAPTGLVTIPLTVTVNGTYAQNELFLQKLSTSMTRLMWVSSIAITPGTSAGDSATTSTTPDSSSSATSTSTDSSPSLQMVISGNLFVLTQADPSTTGGATTPSTTGAGSTAPSGSAS